MSYMHTTDPRARLVELASAQGASLSALSTMIGRNPAYLQQFVRKGSPRKLDEADRRALARFFGVSESELGDAEEISSPLSSGWIDVPRIPASAAAGAGRFAEAEASFGALRFSQVWLRTQGFDPRALSSIAVAGDSMVPLLADGDEILVDTTPRAVREGVHVVRVDDALLVKRLDFSRAGRVGLISDNPAYPPQDLPRGEVTVVGRVVWKCGRI